MLKFAGFPEANEKAITKIADFASFDNMRKMEYKKPLPQYKNKVRKIRNGKVKSYQNYFTDDDKKYFNQVVENRLSSSFGYDYTLW